MKFIKFFDPRGGDGSGGLTGVDRTDSEYDAALDDSFNVDQWAAGEQEFFDFGQRSFRATQRNLDINPFSAVGQDLTDDRGPTLDEMPGEDSDPWWITDAFDNFMGTLNEIELSSVRGKHKELMRPLIEADAKIAELETMKQQAFLANQPGLAMQYDRAIQETMKARKSIEQELDKPMPIVGKSKKQLLEDQMKAEQGDVDYWGKGSLRYQLNNALAKGADASLLDKMTYKWSEDIAGSYSDIKNNVLAIANGYATKALATVAGAALTGGASLLAQAGIWAASTAIDYGITSAMRENETYAELDEGYDSRYKELARQKQLELKLKGEDRELTQAEQMKIQADAYKGWDEAKSANMSLQWLDMATNMLVKAPLSRMLTKNKHLGFWSGTVPGAAVGGALDMYGEKIEEGLQYAFKENYVKHGDMNAWDSIGVSDVVKDITWGGAHQSQLRSAKDYVDAVDSVIAGQVVNVGAIQNAKELYTAYGEQTKATAAVRQMVSDSTAQTWGKKEALNRSNNIKNAVAAGNTGKIAEALTMKELFAQNDEERKAIKDIRDELFAAHSAYSAMTPETLVAKMFNPNFEARPTERIDAMSQAIKNVRATKAKQYVEEAVEDLNKRSFANNEEYNQAVKDVLSNARKAGLDYLSASQLDQLVQDIEQGMPMDMSRFDSFTRETQEKTDNAVTSLYTKLEQQKEDYDQELRDIEEEMKFAELDELIQLTHQRDHVQASRDRLESLLTQYEKTVKQGMDRVKSNASGRGGKDHGDPTLQGSNKVYAEGDSLNDIDKFLTELENDPNVDDELLFTAKHLKALLANEYIEQKAKVGSASNMLSITKSITETLDRAIRDSQAALEDYKSGKTVKLRKQSTRERLEALKLSGYNSADINKALRTKFDEFLKAQKEANPKRDKKRWFKSWLDKKSVSIALNENVDLATLDSLVLDLIEAEENQQGDGTKKLDLYKKILANEDIDKDVARHRAATEINISAIRLQIAKVRQDMANNNLDAVVQFLENASYVPADVHEWAMNNVVKKVDFLYEKYVYGGSELDMMFENAYNENREIALSDDQLADRSDDGFTQEEADDIKTFNSLITLNDIVLQAGTKTIGANRRAIIELSDSDDSREIFIVTDEYIKSKQQDPANPYHYIDITNPNDVYFPVFYYSDAVLTGLDPNTYNVYRYAVVPSQVRSATRQLEAIPTDEYTDSGLNQAAAILERLRRLAARIKITDRFTSEEKKKLLELIDDAMNSSEETIQTLLIKKQQRDADQVRVYAGNATEALRFTQRMLDAMDPASEAYAAVQSLTTCTI